MSRLQLDPHLRREEEDGPGVLLLHLHLLLPTLLILKGGGLSQTFSREDKGGPGQR